MKTDAPGDYSDLIEKGYPIKKRFANTLSELQAILHALGIEETAYVNASLLGMAILSYFEDIDRLKAFEHIERTNIEKIYAYSTFWLLRNKPVQLREGMGTQKHLYLNERVCMLRLVPKMISGANRSPGDFNGRLMEFCKLLLYNFKYRTYTQKSLELMISAFMCGSCFVTSEQR